MNLCYAVGRNSRNRLTTRQKHAKMGTMTNSKSIKKLLASIGIGIVLGTGALTLAACSSQATVASQNLSTEADNFQIQRQVVFYNAITNTYIEEITGLCSVTNGSTQVAVTCEVAKGKYIKDFMGKTTGVMWFAHQTTPKAVSTYQYQIILRPSTVIPSFSTNTPKSLNLITPSDQTTAQPSTGSSGN